MILIVLCYHFESQLLNLKIMKNKKIHYVLNFVTFIILSSNLLGQTRSWSNIYTPHGTPVSAGTLISVDMPTQQKIDYKNYWLAYYNNNIVFMDEATYKYNCHAWAWWVSEGNPEVWINYPQAFIQDDSYYEVSQYSATKVSYGGADHSAITTGTNFWFISKWGPGPLFAHSANECPYDDGDLHFYAKNNAVISGSAAICSSPTEFSVVNLPPGATISWSTSSNITRISTQGSNPCLFESSVSGGENGWINAVFTLNGTQYSVGEKIVQLGSIAPDPITIELKGENYELVEHTNDMWELCPNTIYRLQASYSSTIIGWDWTIPETWEMLSSENSPEILIQTGDYIYWEDEVHVDVEYSPCGEWIYGADALLVTWPPFGCGESLQIDLYPNPATNFITLEINKNGSSSKQILNTNIKISVSDRSGRVWISKDTRENCISLDISSLPKGVYIVNTSMGHKAKTLKFIKSN